MEAQLVELKHHLKRAGEALDASVAKNNEKHHLFEQALADTSPAALERFIGPAGEEAVKAARSEIQNKDARVLENLVQYTHEGFLERVKKVAPLMVNFIEGLVHSVHPPPDTPDLARKDVRRRSSVCTAVAATLIKAVNLGFVWTFREIPSYLVYAVSQGYTAVLVCVLYFLIVSGSSLFSGFLPNVSPSALSGRRVIQVLYLIGQAGY